MSTLSRKLIRPAINLAMYYVVRPIAQVVPLWMLDLVGRVGLLPLAVASTLLASRRARYYLRLCGRSTHPLSVLAFAYRDLVARWRYYYFFLKDSPVEVADDVPPSGVLVTMYDPGAWTLAQWIEAQGGRAIYIADPLENAGGAPAVKPTQKWPHYVADMHRRRLEARHVAPGGAIRRVAPILEAGAPLFLCQDAMWFEEERLHQTFLGLPIYWPVGARYLSQRTEAPIRFARTTFERGRWVLRTEGPLHFDSDDALRRFMEDNLRRRPWDWIYWRVVLDEHLQREASLPDTPMTAEMPLHEDALELVDSPL